ncbi:MAG TPA: iron chelate uptake ABC transporter family permease subunit, partial [Pirellulales bacterium]|nr:iron chelate uptake ABC transporter family permease subunit [Pirellulales bacterium]
MSRALTIAGILGAIYCALAIAGTLSGIVSISPAHVIETIAGAMRIGTADGVPPTEQFVVLQLRLPQVILLGLVGAALSCSGAVLQATFENPLADPGVLGVSGGAAFG